MFDPYLTMGSGSGITLALEACPDIDFTNDHGSCLFTVTVHRKPVGSSVETGAIEAVSPNRSEKGSEKAEDRLLNLLKDQPTMRIADLAATLGISTRAVGKRLARLRSEGSLRRMGPDRGGRWEVLE